MINKLKKQIISSISEVLLNQEFVLDGNKCRRYYGNNIAIVDIQFFNKKMCDFYGGNGACFVLKVGMYYPFTVPENIIKNNDDGFLLPETHDCIIKKSIIRDFNQVPPNKELAPVEKKRKDNWYVDDNGDNIELIISHLMPMITKAVIPWTIKYSDLDYVYNYLKKSREGTTEKGGENGFGAKGSPARNRYIEAFNIEIQNRR